MLSPPEKILLPASHQDLVYTGRWRHEGQLPITSWAGASLCFAMVGCFASLRPGASTSRLDRWNGGIKTAVVTVQLVNDNVGDEASDRVLSTSTVELEAGKDVVLFKDVSSKWVLVEVQLVDWASELQVECVQIASTDHTVPLAAALRSKNRFLFVGDSITCGFCDEDNIGGLTRGVADAYPSALKRLGCGALSVDVVAFPGITLVGKEGAFAAEAGMARKFWHDSPWMSETAWDIKLEDAPSVIVIALGVNDDESGIPPETFVHTYELLLTRLLDQYGAFVNHMIVLSPWSPGNTSGQVDTPTPFEPQLEVAMTQLGSKWPSHTQLHHVHTRGWYEEALTFDGLHPTVQGHAQIAHNLFVWLKDSNIISQNRSVPFI